MATFDRRSFLKQTAMLAATAAAGGAVLAPARGEGVTGGAAGQQPGARPFFAKAAAPDVIAHRGGDGQWPGETLYAFEQAVRLGADVIEMDVHMTTDGVLVLMHNDTVDDTTQRKGCIRKMAWKEVQELDPAHDWRPGGHGDTYPFRGLGLKVPRLEDVFERFRDTDVRMNIEVKQSDPPLVEPLWKMIQQYDMKDRLLVASFDDGVLKQFRALTGGRVATSGSTCEQLELLAGGGAFAALRPVLEKGCKWFVSKTHVRCNPKSLFAKGTPAPAGAGRPDAVQVPHSLGVPNYREKLKDLIAAARQRGLKVHVWTVDEPADMREVLRLGVDGIITDYPGPLLELLGRTRR